jgi:phosphoribosyl 1,2-cyclic phosphate phosphodiesterase
MDLTFLGTAASEGCPSPFCDCDNCRRGRLAGERSWRARAALLVNQDLLLDFGPDLVSSAARLKLSLSALTTLLITHYHEDHFHPHNLTIRDPKFSGEGLPLLHIYGGPRFSRLANKAWETPAQLAFEFHPVEPFQRFKSGPYEIRSFRASHDPRVDPIFYSLSDGRRTFLYATDTGPPPAETLEALGECRFNLVIVDDAMGAAQTTEGHLGDQGIVALRAEMEKRGLLAPEAPWLAHHFWHWHTPPHEELVARLSPLGLIPAYDGMKLSL